jgi:hypothetical protein
MEYNRYAKAILRLANRAKVVVIQRFTGDCGVTGNEV